MCSSFALPSAVMSGWKTNRWSCNTVYKAKNKKKRSVKNTVVRYDALYTSFYYLVENICVFSVGDGFPVPPIPIKMLDIGSEPPTATEGSQMREVE